eukprot:3818399-Amphidinium_carterae.1
MGGATGSFHRIGGDMASALKRKLWIGLELWKGGCLANDRHCQTNPVQLLPSRHEFSTIACFTSL